VHRLDKETSGLLVVAKSDKAHRKLAEQFARREVKKTYVALVHGWMKTATGTINAAIRRDPVRRARMTTRHGGHSRPGREAITHWRVLKQIEGAYGKFSLLEVKIETGRTHQIRVHLASTGHPVAGDTLYGAPGKLLCYGGTGSNPASLERNFLHSSAIQFQHPISNRPLEFEAPLPAELREFLRLIGDGELFPRL
jgi:23S rRNA pseudouridine1911/1915/1917 synthase